jgi:hypothetical protein
VREKLHFGERNTEERDKRRREKGLGPMCQKNVRKSKIKTFISYGARPHRSVSVAG